MEETKSENNDSADAQTRIKQLEREIRKLNREISHLSNAIAQEKTAYTTVLNQQKASTFIVRERERYLALLLANSPSIILFLSQTGRVEFCTEYFIAKAGHSSAAEVLGRKANEVFMPIMDEAPRNKLHEQCISVIESNAPAYHDVTFHFGKTGDDEDFAGLLVPMSDSEQNSGGIMLMFHDITDLKRSREEALSASRAKSDFLSNMSHEIRTPMNAIIGMTAIGKSSTDVERKDYCLSRIEGASHHLLGIINDILDMSKIEASKFELSPIEFDFERMLRQVVNVTSFRVDEKHQSFNVNIDPAIPKYLIGDDQRLAQVITNLIGNAVKFTPEGGSIGLDTRLVAEDGDVCTIQMQVTDTGIGISPQQQRKLFKSFNQAESSTTREFGGTGLGLAISKSIVEMMGGTIWIESELGKGSTFAFKVQALRGKEKAVNQYTNVSWGDVRVLAVDDDPDVLEYFKEIIHRFGANCDTALSGAEALDLVEKNGNYSICFVDWKMPDMDGVRLTSELKAQDSGDSSIVIMISSADWTTVEKEAKEAGVSKFLSKPLFPSSIADIISETLAVVPQVAADATGDDTKLDFHGANILLAEDVEINREIVIALLEPASLAIDCAENGAEAVRMYSAAPGKYAIVFMDVQMPTMDGYEATRQIRRLEAPEAKSVPIIAMTANVFREDIEKCLEAGMNDHIGKPLDFEAVIDILKKYL